MEKMSYRQENYMLISIEYFHQKNLCCKLADKVNYSIRFVTKNKEGKSLI